MFDQNHYVPVLKAKRGELKALLETKSRERMTPLIEPILKSTPKQLANLIGNSWGHQFAVFIDGLHWDAHFPDRAGKLMGDLCRFLGAQQVKFVPITGLDRSGAYQEAVSVSVQKIGRGLGIRVGSRDLLDAQAFQSTVPELIQAMKVATNQVDLIVDFGATEVASEDHLALTMRSTLEQIPFLDGWRTLTLVATGFPSTLGMLPKGWSEVPRTEWLAWNKLQLRRIWGKRKPSFGDYAVSHSRLPHEGRGRTLGQIRYTTNDSFLVYKGNDVQKDPRGFKQFFDICEELTERQEFSGCEFSWGDRQIAEKATSEGSPGNAQTWKEIGANHHFEMVMTQLASYPGP